MNAFLWSVSVFWVLIYAIRSCASSSSSQSLLPVTAGGRPSSKFRLAKSNGLEFNVRNFHLEVRSSALNSLHDAWIAFWRRDIEEAWMTRGVKVVLRMFYNVGIVFGILGFLAGIGVLVYSCESYFREMLLPQSRIQNGGFVKRSMDVPVTAQRSGFAVSAIIPGVTVPWSHFPLILLALFVSQCFHEAGHAITGAVEGLPVHSVGASLTVILPSAFVVFASPMDTLSTVGRLRVISSGAWHNLVLWALLYFVSLSNIKSTWTIFGWQNVSDLGVVVHGVEESSPLVFHLPPGSIVTSLDDMPLGSTEDFAEEIWTRYLLRTKNPSEEGWCTDVDVFFNQPTSCCEANGTGQIAHPPAAQLSCFIPMQEGDQGHCIDPVPILASSHSQRCFSTSDCNENTTANETTGGAKECIRPYATSQLLRITVSSPLWEKAEENGANHSRPSIVLWSGPSEEVWEQVQVGRLAPRYRFLPTWFPYTLSTFFSYLSTLSLSLYIFNLFPLPFLDGSHFLSALLDYLGNSRDQTSYESGFTEDYDIELGDGRDNYVPPRVRQAATTTLVRWIHDRSQALHIWTRSWRRRIRRRKATIERVVRYATIALMCVTVVGMAWPS
ncbi:hypothetical protein ACEPAI_8734 [Sanghuangporus weigelae]